MNSLKEKIIVALDSENVTESKEIVKKLDNLVTFYKIGLRTFVNDGFKIASEIKNLGNRLFLDLKLYDIESTIRETVLKLSDHDIDFLTVNGDPAIVEAAVAGRSNKKMKILAVTFLTNYTRRNLDDNLVKAGDLGSLTLKRAGHAICAGADGVISSPLELQKIRNATLIKDKLIVTPGIRTGGKFSGDQKRISSPGKAIALGADYIVIGRPIWESKDPRKSVHRILKNMKAPFEEE